jgi:hypothetical protein
MSLVTAMIPMKNSSNNLTSLEMPSCVECFVLIHSPIIINMKELEEVTSKVHKKYNG